SIVELARFGLGEGDQFVHVACRKRRVRDEDLRNEGDQADRHEVLFDVKRKMFVELRVDRVRGKREQDRIAVWRRLRDQIGAQDAGGTATVVDDDGLPQQRGKWLGYDARDNVGTAAGRIGNDEANRPIGVALGFLRADRGDTEKACQQQRGYA